MMKTVQPLTSTSVQLAIAISGPGTFDLGAHIEVLCKKLNESEPFILQSCQIHSALIVVNMDS